jgi:serine/threonine protein kinase
MDSMVKTRGTFAYLAPELFYGKIYNAKSDIYSLGILNWEIVYRIIRRRYAAPYSEFPKLKHDFQIFFHAAENNGRPTIPPSCHPGLTELIQQCLHADPDRRPSSTE